MRSRTALDTCLRLSIAVLALLVLTTSAGAQAPSPSAVAPAPEAPAAIPIASIAVEAATLASRLKSIASDLPAPDRQHEIIDGLPALDTTIGELAKRTESRLEHGYDRSDLDSLGAGWRGLTASLNAWERALERRLALLDKHSSDLVHRVEVWQATSKSAREDRAPAELRAQISEAQAALKKGADQLRRSRDETLALQKRVVALHARVNGEFERVAEAREAVLTHVLTRNDPPLWAVELGDVQPRLAVFRSTLADSLRSIESYGRRESQRFFGHALIIALLVWVSWMARGWLTGLPPERARPLPAALTHPLAAGLVLGLSLTTWIHSEAPPKLVWSVSLGALPFLFYVLGSILPRSLRRPVIGFIALVVLDLTRRVLMDLELLARGLLVMEAALAFAGLLWLRRPERLSQVPHIGSLLWLRVLGFWLHFALFASVISLGGAIFGWTSLADLLLITLVMGTFVGATLFTATLVLEAISEAAAYSGKFDRIGIVRNHRRTFLRVVSRSARTVAFLTWAYAVLGQMALQDSFLAAARSLLAAPLGYGGLQITLGGLVAFGLAIWISWLLARFVPSLLEDEVFPRVSLPRGVPYALSTISRYTILVFGFIAAVAALGFQIGNLALLVSALGVGIGFGMQNMVNNFISGLILLFERPIQVGDLVSLDQLLGKVKRIGIRSSTIRTFDGADVIVPNGDLISNRVTNWTLADTRRRVIVSVGVTYGTPAQGVIDLLVEVARANADVLEDPAPYGLFTGFGDSSLDFELRAWTESGDAMTIVRSDLTVAIQAALDEAAIVVPFPQRDLHVKTLPEEPSLA